MEKIIEVSKAITKEYKINANNEFIKMYNVNLSNISAELFTNALLYHKLNKIYPVLNNDVLYDSIDIKRIIKYLDLCFKIYFDNLKVTPDLQSCFIAIKTIPNFLRINKYNKVMIFNQLFFDVNNKVKFYSEPLVACSYLIIFNCTLLYENKYYKSGTYITFNPHLNPVFECTKDNDYYNAYAVFIANCKLNIYGSKIRDIKFSF